MKKINGQMIKIFALAAALFAAGTMGMKEAGASERADAINQWVWTARTVEQVKEDLNSMQDNTYTIVMGDTLWALGEASGISFMEIAERNGISDPDWIVEGHKIIFENDGRTVRIQDGQGKFKEQIIVENQNVGNPALTIEGSENNSNVNPEPNNQNNSQNATNPVPPKTDNGSTDSTTSPNVPDNDSGSSENNIKPNSPEDDNESEIDNGPTNPPTDGDNENGSGGEETEQELYRITPLGNSDMEFDSNIEAVKWGHAQTIDPESSWYGMIPTSKPLLWSNGEILSYSVDFY